MSKYKRRSPYKTEIGRHGKEIRPLSPEMEERFRSRISEVPNEKGCLLWTAGVFANGYGRFRLQGGNCKAHRLAFFLANGYCDPKLLVRHSCGDRRCCEPTHLEQGTCADNAADTIRHGNTPTGDRNGLRLHPECAARGDRNGASRHPECVLRGESHGRTKLTEAIVRQIRVLHDVGIGCSEMGRMYGVYPSTISAIYLRKIWKHVA